MDDWPSFNDELTRKTSQTLSKFTALYDSARISKREYFLIVSSLYDTTSGMINKDVSDLLADIHKELRNAG